MQARVLSTKWLKPGARCPREILGTRSQLKGAALVKGSVVNKTFFMKRSTVNVTELRFDSHYKGLVKKENHRTCSLFQTLKKDNTQALLAAYKKTIYVRPTKHFRI